MAASWTLVRSPWKWAEMLSEVRSPNNTLVAHSAMCPVRYHSNCLPPAAAGYYFLSEARALPRMDTVVDTATNIPNWVSFILRRFYVKMVASCNNSIPKYLFFSVHFWDHDMTWCRRNMEKRTFMTETWEINFDSQETETEFGGKFAARVVL